MLLVERIHEGSATAAEVLELPFDLRCKSRLRTQLATGEEIGIFLPPGTVLRGGTRLEANDGRVVAVVAAKEPLMEVRTCLLYTSPSPRDLSTSRMPSSA